MGYRQEGWRVNKAALRNRNLHRRLPPLTRDLRVHYAHPSNLLPLRSNSTLTLLSYRLQALDEVKHFWGWQSPKLQGSSGMAGAVLEAWNSEPLPVPSLPRCSRIPECLQSNFRVNAWSSSGSQGCDLTVLCCCTSGIQGQGCPVLYKCVN